ncbi:MULTISPECIES: Sec-independent protein translocase protein TatB [Pseudomonas]|uniref:Sec-independent protein translocase protein TatB n=2 Tax=Pseudomonas TaxID=286 RepID=A0AAP9N3K0_PSEPU|nr:MULTISPECIES: Sec-independent protein translocase protein TatB [Pseudomonas]AEJ14589.1 sec-independent translocase [Pseudomonas putida S16]KKX67347.1 preprotein translocase subunit TatB [Pseudomonas putida]MDD2036094.1 Sec-independent protein translocase protein TatB [Pseudomonas putida]MDD2041109.1 Sec-independent protein translocase protein TatB [Pseudomonas putida]PHN28437.1 preprotein translocase subunit TatB [Pseudomonas sp. ICMP 564]
MFGISFTELLLVALVSLLVLGPERLPGAARAAGMWVGRLKRSFNAIKEELAREIGADEIRRRLHSGRIISLEDEARKIFAPTNQELTLVAHVTDQKIVPQTPAVDESASAVDTPPPATPAPNNSNLPNLLPRAS